MADKLVVQMTPEAHDGVHPIAMPLVPVQMRIGARIGWQHIALVDSGAAFTLARTRVAARLGLDAAAVRASSDVVTLSGAGAGPRISAWGWEVDLYLGGGSAEHRVMLPRARVYFTDASLASFDVLLGHHDVFERLTFTVLNHAPTPRFVLRTPSSR